MLHQLTFGDLVEEENGLGHHIRVPENEAALIVVDRAKAIAALRNHAINPFVCAVRGPQNEVEVVWKRYKANPSKYEIYYYPLNS